MSEFSAWNPLIATEGSQIRIHKYSVCVCVCVCTCTHLTKFTASNVILGKPEEQIVASDLRYTGNRNNSIKPSQVVEIRSFSPSLDFWYQKSDDGDGVGL